MEWVTHVRGRLPVRGEILQLLDPLEEPAGGGGVSASQVAKLGADCRFYTALGGDGAGEESERRLRESGVRVLVARRPGPQPRAVTIVDPTRERTILLLGRRIDATLDDPLPWGDLATCDAVYFTGGDPRTLEAARAARRLVVTARRLEVLIASEVRVDVLVASGTDPAEAVDEAALPVPPAAVVRTQGGLGGTYREGAGPTHRFPPAPVPGPPVSSYGCGDSFAAGLTVGLGRGLSLADAIALGARCGAAVLTGRGGLEAQLQVQPPETF